jgi:hypothetical protein
MKCEHCGHEILEPILSDYCTNCGKPLGISKDKLIRDTTPNSERLYGPKFVIREWNPALFPVVASIIPVLILAYFAAGIAAAAILTFLDLLLALFLYLRAPAYLFYEDRLRIFEAGGMTREIEYFQIQKISSLTASPADQKYEGGFIISITGGPIRYIEIPANPQNSELGVDLTSWLSARAALRKT